MKDFLEALRIVGDSWPIAAMIVGLSTTTLFSIITISVNRAVTKRTAIKAQREIEGQRLDYQFNPRVIAPKARNDQ